MDKILVAGSVEGRFTELFNRVKTVNNKSGPFQMLLCIGEFFPKDFQEDLIIPSAPIPTFILGPVNQSQSNYYPNITGCEIAQNITYLGQRGVYTDAGGLKIAYFSGIEATKEKTNVEFNYEDVKNLEIRLLNESGFKGVDILLTAQWPAGIENNAPVQPERKVENPSLLISRLAASLKPRYHFSEGLEGIHYERAPYRNHEVLAEQALQFTRFISLAKVGNPEKKKWLYAFNVTPMKDMSAAELVRQPAVDITDNPYSKMPSIKLNTSSNVIEHKTATSNQFFYDQSYTGEDNRYNKRPYGGRGRGGGRGGRGGGMGRGGMIGSDGLEHGGKRPRGNLPPPGPCWFCLASKEVEKHLVVSIGESVYLTLAKGQLTDDHVLILPIGHFQSTLECSEDVIEEINKFKSALKRYFASQDKAVIFYERNFKSPHLQIQAIPIPLSKTVGLKLYCQEFAEKEEIEFQEFPENAELFQMTKIGFPYFFLELPDGNKLFAQIHKNFPIQFGRELLASEHLLNCPDKVDWKQCKVSKEEETRLSSNFRKLYKSFDWTL